MRHLLALPLLATLAGCSFYGSDASPDPGSGALVWVAKSYVGGQQCSTRRYEPPTPERELEQVGVEVYAGVVEHQAVCEACGCPSYSAVHYAEVRESNVERAEREGFARSALPDRG